MSDAQVPDSLVDKTIAVLGGTGPQGRGLAGRFASAGLTVVIGSRDSQRAADAAAPVDEGSAAEQAQFLLPDSTVVRAFHHVSAVTLEDPDIATIETDVLVLGDVREATDLRYSLSR